MFLFLKLNLITNLNYIYNPMQSQLENDIVKPKNNMLVYDRLLPFSVDVNRNLFFIDTVIPGIRRKKHRMMFFCQQEEDDYKKDLDLSKYLLKNQIKKEPIPIKQPSWTSNKSFIDDNYYTNNMDYLNKHILIGSKNGNLLLQTQQWNEVPIIKQFSSYERSNFLSVSFFKSIDKIIYSKMNEKLSILDVNAGATISYNIEQSTNCIVPYDHHCILITTKQGHIGLFDERIKHVPIYYKAHRDEVCNLIFDNSKKYIFSGGNDNHVITYDIRKNKIDKLLSYSHSAGVKGIAFNKKLLIPRD